MPKYFKDFTFKNKKLSSLSADYVSVSFNESDERNFGMSRSMEKGETNRYHTVANHFYDKWDEPLKFELHITKNPCEYGEQKYMEIYESEIREITRWLTSSHLPSWIEFEYLPEDDNEVTNYHGWFNNIEPFVVGGKVYGLKLSFECTSSFGYTSEITNEIVVSSYDNIKIFNDSDELENYCYPTVTINPNNNGQIYICNASDCKVLASGKLTNSENYFDEMLDKIDDYAVIYALTVDYIAADGDSAFNINPLCNDTAVQFRLTDVYGKTTKHTAYYLPDTLEYFIIEGGFMYMTVYKDLNVYMNCQKLTITDDIGRMITYDKMGVSDVDSIYWLRLLHGENNLILYGNCTFEIKYRESRKAGD